MLRRFVIYDDKGGGALISFYQKRAPCNYSKGKYEQTKVKPKLGKCDHGKNAVISSCVAGVMFMWTNTALLNAQKWHGETAK